MHGPSGRAQSWSVFDRRQPTPTPIASSPAPFSYPVEGPSRSSSVAYSSPQSGPRFKTVIHPEQYDERELRQKLLQSRARLQTSFDAIAEKYGSVPPEEDDEIDLFTGNVTKNRGHLLELEPRLFAEGSDYQDEAVEDDQDGIRLDQLRLHSEPVRGPDQIEFPEDEDELGDWGDKSGLDAQFPATEIEQEWTAEDLVDLEEFMRAEALRRARCGEEELEYERFQGASSSPLRNLSQLVLETSPEVEEVEVMDEPELYENSRVHSQRRVTFSHRRSSTPPHTTHPRESVSSPRGRSHPHRPECRTLELSRSVPNLRGAYAAPAHRLPKEVSRSVNDLSRSASGHLVHYEEVTTRVVTVHDQAQVPRSRKGKDRTLPPLPSKERDRPLAELSQRTPSRSSYNGSGRLPSARSIQEVTTVRRRQTWVSPPSSGRKASDKGPSQRQSRPPSLWPSPFPNHPSSSSSSAPPSSPLFRKRIHSRESHRPHSQRSQNPHPEAVSVSRFIAVDEETGDLPFVNTLAKTPSPRRPRQSLTERSRDQAALLAALQLPVAPPEGTPGYFSSLSLFHEKPRACKACKSASGDRARLAVYCRGRGRPHLCAYYEEEFDLSAELIAVAAEASPAPIIAAPVPPEGWPGYTRTLRVEKNAVRCCRPCKDAGGERAALAAYCLGRGRRSLCAYHAADGASQSPREVSTSETPVQAAKTGTGLESTLSSHPLPPRTSGYMQNLTEIRGVVRCCRACKQAGGERGALAGYCRGRTRPWLCAYYGSVANVDTASEACVSTDADPEADLGADAHPYSTASIGEVATDANMLWPLSSHPSNQPGVVSIKGNTPRTCRACRGAGGARASLAAHCRGRIRPAMCAHYGLETASTLPAAHLSHAISLRKVEGPGMEDDPGSQNLTVKGDERGPAILPATTPMNHELTSDSSASDDGSSASDVYNDGRFSTYASSATPDDTDEDMYDNESLDGNPSDEEASVAHSESDSGTSVLSTGFADTQIFVDISRGAAANYSLPPADERYAYQLLYVDTDGVYDLARCSRCLSAGEEQGHRALWCPGRETAGTCVLAAEVAPHMSPISGPSSRALNTLFTPPLSVERVLDPGMQEPPDPVNEHNKKNDNHVDVTLQQSGGPLTRSDSSAPSDGRFPTPPSSSLSGSPKSSSTCTTDKRRAAPTSGASLSARKSQQSLNHTLRGAGVDYGPPPKGLLSPRKVHRDSSATVPTLAWSVSRANYMLQVPEGSRSSVGLMAPPPVPPPREAVAATTQTSALKAPQTTPRSSKSVSIISRAQTTPHKRIRDPDSDSEPEVLATAPRERAPSPWIVSSSTPRKKTRMELRAEREASLLEDNSHEWGLDLEVGVEIARQFREGSITLPVSEHRSLPSGSSGRAIL